MLKTRLAATQICLGVIGMLLVGVSYFVFSGRLIEPLERIEGLADDGESQLQQSAGLLTGLQGVAVELEASTIAHQQTVDSALESTVRFSHTIRQWESEANAFAEISRDASDVVDKLQEQLPLRVPSVDVSTRTVEFKRPEVKLETEEFTVAYPSITVDTRTESIDLGLKKIELKYPVGMTTKEQKKTVRIADLPRVTLVDESVAVPRVEVSEQLLLQSEKALLLKTSKQLAATSSSLTDTAGSLAELRSFIAGDLSTSLRQTKSNLTGVSSQLRQLHQDRIPTAITKLDSQRSELHDSRAALAVLPNLVRLGFLVLGLVPLSVLLSGLGNFAVARSES